MFFIFSKYYKSSFPQFGIAPLISCQKGYKTLYTTCSDLINDLNAGVYEKTLEKRMRKYTNPDLLVIDEMGHDRLELQVVKEAHLLFKVIDQRYNDNKSLIFTTNVEEADWAEFLGDPITTSYPHFYIMRSYI